MIGIRGIAKKPITDATAIAENIVSGKIAYNNDGRIVGTLSESSVLYKRTITIPKGTYTSHKTSVKVYKEAGQLLNVSNAYTMKDMYAEIGADIETISSDSMTSGYNYWKTYVYLVEGNFIDRTDLEPAGVSYIDWNGTLKNLIYSYDIASLRKQFDLQLLIPNTTSDYSDGGSDYTQTNDYVVNVAFSNNFYAIYVATKSGGWTISSVEIPKDYVIDLYFTKRRD